MQKTSKVMLDNGVHPEIKLGTLLIDNNKDVWIVYSYYNPNNCFMYFNALCISSNKGAVHFYFSANPNIDSDEVYTHLNYFKFKVLIGSVTITQK